VVKGSGRMTLGRDIFDMAPGDSVLIAPGTPHRVENTGSEPLVIMCCCTPPYAHGDTVLTGKNRQGEGA
jgi:mannose-6-phosphate isomerase-like protein (cupin superfamily)